MKLLNFTIIKLTLFLALGILFGYFFKVDLKISGITLLLSLILLAIAYFVGKKQFNTNLIFGIFSFLTIFVAGIFVLNVHNQKHWPNHYTQSENFNLDQANELQLKVTEVLKSSVYQDKYFVDVLRLDNKKVRGKLLLNIDKDTLTNPLKVDDILFSKSQLETIVKPLNPHQFNYTKYLEKKYVYHQIYASGNKLLIKDNTTPSILGLASTIRETINFKLRRYNFEDDQLAIINAILLGQKRDLSKDLYQQYAGAGVIHILAVSGLHVGIILLILQFLLKPMEHLRNGNTYKILIIVVLLWCFAIIAGLSPSVVRAVTMFSIVAIGLNIKRHTGVFNTLASSMFILLLFKPTFLFDVGFQLSYLAVFAIVWIQPMLYKLWSPKYKVVDYFWQIFTVTMAAQIGVAPLSLFYFHQFPGLFFLSNLVIIPVLGLILGLGILVIFLALANALPEFIIKLYGGIINSLNTFVGWVAQQEAFLFKSISFGIVAMLFSYLLIVLGIRTIQKRTFKRLATFLLIVLIAQGFAIYTKSKISNSFTILHKSRQTLLAFKNNNALHLFHNLDSLNLKKDNTINNLVIGEYIKNISQDSVSSVYKVNNELLLVIDNTSSYKVSFKPDMVLLRNSPKVNLNRLIKHLQPKRIIADGSNYKSYIARWEETCKNEKLPFHATAKKGALTIDYAK